MSPETLYKTWLREYGGIALKVARAYTRAPEDCDDLVQEILLQVWRSLRQFEGRSCASTWFYRVALNTAIGWRRKEHRRRARQQPLFAEEDFPAIESDSAQQAQQREAVERLYVAIRQLPKTDAAVVLLDLDDLNYRQMAEILGISESNVGVKLNRARRALGKLLDESR
jgi:RNA polymerase sigma-70 factor (ECF subfamily)